ncbi:dihydrolipoamide acetyltransferase family protein, partial [Cellulomonas carbonis]
RRLAHDLGVDLASVPGSGPDGLVTRDDVVAWAGRSTPGGTDAVGDTAPVQPAARERRIPVTGVRRRTAEAMVASAFTAPHATEFLTVDVTPSLELLERLRQDRRFSGTRVTLLTLVAKAVLVALRRTPSLNARWDEEAGEVVERDYVHLGVAAATPRGLLVPVVHDADAMDLLALASALADLTSAAREGTTEPRALVGGTTTVTNIGVFGVDAGTPILVPGEASILATGAVRRRPWEHEGGIALRSVMTLSVSFDHRLVDGEQASRYLADVGAVLASPGATLALV